MSSSSLIYIPMNKHASTCIQSIFNESVAMREALEEILVFIVVDFDL